MLSGKPQPSRSAASGASSGGCIRRIRYDAVGCGHREQSHHTFGQHSLFVLYRLSERFGLPVVPERADWLMGELKRRRAIRPLAGLGCSPVLITGTKARFLSWISRG